MCFEPNSYCAALKLSPSYDSIRKLGESLNEMNAMSDMVIMALEL